MCFDIQINLFFDPPASHTVLSSLSNGYVMDPILNLGSLVGMKMILGF